MPWRLILFIISLVLITFFIGFNLENACNVNFGFKQFDNVPIFLTVMLSFIAGIVVTLPFTFGKCRQKAEKPSKPAKTSINYNATSSAGVAKEKKDFKNLFAHKKNNTPSIAIENPKSTSDNENTIVSINSFENTSTDTALQDKTIEEREKN